MSKETFEKIISNKNVILAHGHTAMDEVIDIVCNIKLANASIRKCKKPLALFNAALFMLPEDYATQLNHVFLYP